MSTEKQLKRIQIDLDPEMVHMVSVLCDRHGMNTKNFVEYIIRIATGLLPPPPIAPLVTKEQPPESNEQTPATTASQPENEEIPAIESNKTERLETARQALQNTAPKPTVPTEEPDPTDWKPNRNTAAYRTRAANGIFTDGISFRLNKFGKTSYHRTLEEAIKHRDE